MSLKDALLKAGLKSSKSQNERDFKPKKEKKKSEVHQERRNFCEVCECIHPDVERFIHRMPSIDAQWICVNCADMAKIHDDFRVTHQSDFAKNRQYRRYYGPTKDFSKEQNKVQKDNRSPNYKNDKKDKNFNR